MSDFISHKYIKVHTEYQNINKFILATIVGLLLTTIEGVAGINLPILRYIIYAVALYYFLMGIIQTYSTNNYSGFFIKVSLITLFISVVFSIIIAIPSLISSAGNYVNIKRVLSGQLLLFLFPLILLMKPKLFIIKKTFVLSYKLSVLYLLFTIPLIIYFATNPKSGAEGFVRNFASGSTIILLTIAYHSRRVKIVTVLTFIISLLLMVLHARRNMILYLSLVLIFLLIIMLFSSSKQVKRSRMSFILGLVFIASLSFLVIYLLNLDFTYTIERFTTTASEGINYSRETVLEEFKTDFNRTPVDWWIGRGLNGTFYSLLGGGRDAFGALQAGQREVIENGYYYLILKAGLLYVIPFALLSIIGFIKGFFYSRNMLSKAAAAIVLINLVDLIGFGMPGLHLKYLILWFSLALCYSTRIRNYSDDLIKRFIAIK